MTLIDRAKGAAKAIVAIVTPIATAAALEAVAELSSSTDTLVAALATAVLVYLTPNKAPTA